MGFDESLVRQQEGLHVLILKLKVVRLQEKTLVPEQWFSGFQCYAPLLRKVFKSRPDFPWGQDIPP